MAAARPVEDDAFYILEGELTFGFGGRVPAPPGTFVLVPPE